MAPDRLDYTLFDKVFIRPARVPLAVALVEHAFANHTAAGGPLEKGSVPHFECLDVFYQTIPASVPAGVGRTAAAFEPGIVENTVADFAPFCH